MAMTGGGFFSLNHIHVNSDLPSRKHLTDLKGASQDSVQVQNEVGHPTMRNFGLIPPSKSRCILDTRLFFNMFPPEPCMNTSAPTTTEN